MYMGSAEFSDTKRPAVDPFSVITSLGETVQVLEFIEVCG